MNKTPTFIVLGVLLSLGCAGTQAPPAAPSSLHQDSACGAVTLRVTRATGEALDSGDVKLGEALAGHAVLPAACHTGVYAIDPAAREAKEVLGATMRSAGDLAVFGPAGPDYQPAAAGRQILLLLAISEPRFLGPREILEVLNQREEGRACVVVGAPCSTAVVEIHVRQ